MNHPLTPALERATNASEALRALLLADPASLPVADADRLTWVRRVLATELREAPWQDAWVRRCACRLSAALSPDP